MNAEYRVHSVEFVRGSEADAHLQLQKLLTTEARGGWRLKEIIPPTWRGPGLLVVMERLEAPAASS